MAPEPVLTLSEVDVWFAAGPQVLSDVDLTVASGEHWALLGPNGAGKSTLLAIAGAQRFPSRGSVELLGRRVGRTDLRELRALIGTVDPRLRMPAELDISGYVATGATQTVQPVRAPTHAEEVRVAELLELLGLDGKADRSVAVCSQGERSRARLARALVNAPALLLLDEPATGLDLPGRADLLDAVETAARELPRLATVTIAHHLEELPVTTSHVALLHDGRLQTQGGVELLADDAALSRCFGRPVHAVELEGRWFATAGR